jgi:hypothetical protein
LGLQVQVLLGRLKEKRMKKKNSYYFYRTIQSSDLKKWGTASLEGFLYKELQEQNLNFQDCEDISLYFEGNMLNIPAYVGIELAKSVANLLQKGVRLNLTYN